MKNRIIHMNQTDFAEVNRQIYRNGDVFCVEINGTECKHLSEYLSDISSKLQFPTEAKRKIIENFEQSILPWKAELILYLKVVIVWRRMIPIIKNTMHVHSELIGFSGMQEITCIR